MGDAPLTTSPPTCCARRSPTAFGGKVPQPSSLYELHRRSLRPRTTWGKSQSYAVDSEKTQLGFSCVLVLRAFIISTFSVPGTSTDTDKVHGCTGHRPASRHTGRLVAPSCGIEENVQHLVELFCRFRKAHRDNFWRDFAQHPDYREACSAWLRCKGNTGHIIRRQRKTSFVLAISGLTWSYPSSAQRRHHPRSLFAPVIVIFPFSTGNFDNAKFGSADGFLNVFVTKLRFDSPSQGCNLLNVGFAREMDKSIAFMRSVARCTVVRSRAPSMGTSTTCSAW